MTKLELQRKYHAEIMRQLREMQADYALMIARTNATLEAFKDVSIRYTDS